MIQSLITFYNVGLNEKNLPYNFTALNNILSAGAIRQDGQVYELYLTNLPFGATFNISEEVYNIVKSATYLRIQNTDPEAPRPVYVRYCFINNFLEIANGNYAVSYTIDDWTSFYLNPDSPYNIQIDGFTERANVPLLSGTGYTTKINTNLTPLVGERDEKGHKIINNLTRAAVPFYGILLPDGYKCAVYFINTPKYNGSPSGAIAHGTVSDFDLKTKTIRNITRENSNIYFMVFDQNGDNCEIVGKDSEQGQYQTILGAGNYKISYPDDSTIEKVMFFDFIPSRDQVRWNWGWDGTRLLVGGTTDNNLKLELADIYHHNNGTYYKALYLNNFCPITYAYLLGANLLINGAAFTLQDNLTDYYKKSPYQCIDENRKIRIKFLTTQIDVPADFLTKDSEIYVGYSGDGETITLKFVSQYNAATDLDENIFTSTGQNTNYFDLVHVRDFKSYKNAKITGAAGIAATALGGVTALGSSIATGNVAGVVGSLSGGAQGIISGVQKLQGLTPAQQSPANGDFTLTIMINNINLPIIVEFIEELPRNKIAALKYFEENGAAVSMPFDDYISNCQMQAYNAIKMAIIDVTGAPQQIARRIEETFLNGVTLWTATDVGNKRVINYPLAVVS